MPMAICDNGHLRGYANPRGTKLRDFPPCPCGGKWHAAVFDDAKATYVPRKSRTSHKGRKMGVCPVCRKNRLLTLERKWKTWERPAPDVEKVVEITVELPDGVQPCWYHRAAQVVEALEKLAAKAKTLADLPVAEAAQSELDTILGVKR